VIWCGVLMVWTLRVPIGTDAGDGCDVRRCGLVGGWGEAAMEWMVEHQYACAQPSYEYEWADADEWNAVLPP
jgi:hypothetical protein